MFRYNFIQKAASFYKKQLGLNGVDITVKFVDKIEQDGKFCAGQAKQNEDFKSFTIEIVRTDNLMRKLITLAHEMVHVKQLVQKELMFTTVNVIWKGASVHRDIVKKIEWEKLPWEEEANEKQNELYKQYMKSLNWWKKLLWSFS